MSMELYEEPWEWYLTDMVRYYRNTDTISCVHRDFDDWCMFCLFLVNHVERSIVEIKCEKESQKR